MFGLCIRIFYLLVCCYLRALSWVCVGMHLVQIENVGLWKHSPISSVGRAHDFYSCGRGFDPHIGCKFVFGRSVGGSKRLTILKFCIPFIVDTITFCFVQCKCISLVGRSWSTNGYISLLGTKRNLFWFKNNPNFSQWWTEAKDDCGHYFVKSWTVKMGWFRWKNQENATSGWSPTPGEVHPHILFFRCLCTISFLASRTKKLWIIISELPTIELT